MLGQPMFQPMQMPQQMQMPPQMPMHQMHMPPQMQQQNGFSVQRIRSGYARRYSNSIFGDKWKTIFLCLFDDGTLRWYKKPDHAQPKGFARIQEIGSIIYVGPRAAQTYGVNEALPADANIHRLMAFPLSSAPDAPIERFVFLDEQEADAWIAAIHSFLGKLPQMPMFNGMAPGVGMPPHMMPPAPLGFQPQRPMGPGAMQNPYEFGAPPQFNGIGPEVHPFDDLNPMQNFGGAGGYPAAPWRSRPEERRPRRYDYAEESEGSEEFDERHHRERHGGRYRRY